MDGIIPAGAGKSTTLIPGTYAFGDHPRGCGEKLVVKQLDLVELGSSPRVRGKVSWAKRLRFRLRIIPAGAGKRRRFSPLTSRGWDHPRGCGEKESHLTKTFSKAGSSPRVRGKAGAVASTFLGVGIIPAGAGKRVGPWAVSRARGDHPRGCGEKDRRAKQKQAAEGSSPRVRGKARPCRALGLVGRIIPAGAGKREAAKAYIPDPADHPRGCGEKHGSSPFGPLRPGSSPRVRGKGGPPSVSHWGAGIIPAGAGKS